MKKTLIYIISGLLCLVISIISYKKYKQHSTFINTEDIPFISSNRAKLLSNESIKNDSTILVNSNVPNFTKIVAKSVNAVVSIKNYTNKYNKIQYFDPFEFFFGFPDNFKNKSVPFTKNNMHITSGSGVIISPNGYIITNNHVIEDAEKIEVILNNQKKYKAKLIGTDSNIDIALLKISEKTKLPFIYFSNSDNVEVGEWVLAIGNPFGLNSTVTAGIVSAKSRNLGIIKRNKNTSIPIESFIQTDAAINPGNSGGALLNFKGELIGINTAIHSRTGGYEGYGFAIPCNLIEKTVKDLKKYGIVQRAFIGIIPLDLSNEEELKLYNQKYNKNIKLQQGVMIIRLNQKNSPLNNILKINDIIKEINGISIQNFAELSSIIGSKYPGEKIKIKIIRNGINKELTVTLMDIEGNTKIRNKLEMTILEWLGIKVKILDKATQQNLSINHGLKVIALKDKSLNKFELEKGDIILSINGRKVDNPNDVNLLLKNYIGDVYIKFIKQNGEIVIRGFEME